MEAVRLRVSSNFRANSGHTFGDITLSSHVIGSLVAPMLIVLSALSVKGW